MDLSLAAVIGASTLFIGILVKVVGFPAQIKKNSELGSTEGLSTTFTVLAFISYLLWTAHGIMQNDMVVWLGQGLGLVTTGILLGQIYYFKNKKKK